MCPVCVWRNGLPTICVWEAHAWCAKASHRVCYAHPPGFCGLQESKKSWYAPSAAPRKGRCPDPPCGGLGMHLTRGVGAPPFTVLKKLVHGCMREVHSQGCVWEWGVAPAGSPVCVCVSGRRRCQVCVVWGGNRKCVVGSVFSHGSSFCFTFTRAVGTARSAAPLWPFSCAFFFLARTPPPRLSQVPA